MKVSETGTQTLLGYTDLLGQTLRYIDGFAQFCDTRPLKVEEATEIRDRLQEHYGDYNDNLEEIATEVDNRMKKALGLKKSPFELRKMMENFTKKYPVLAKDWKAPTEPAVVTDADPKSNGKAKVVKMPEKPKDKPAESKK